MTDSIREQMQPNLPTGQLEQQRTKSVSEKPPASDWLTFEKRQGPSAPMGRLLSIRGRVRRCSCDNPKRMSRTLGELTSMFTTPSQNEQLAFVMQIPATSSCLHNGALLTPAAWLTQRPVRQKKRACSLTQKPPDR